MGSCKTLCCICNFDKKVLLHDYKRRTARRAASTRSTVQGGKGSTPIPARRNRILAGRGTPVPAREVTYLRWQGTLTLAWVGVPPGKDLGPDTREGTWDQRPVKTLSSLILRMRAVKISSVWGGIEE